MTTTDRACEGADTNKIVQGGDDMDECRHCGTCVRWDLAQHSFFGFQTCNERRPGLAAYTDTTDNAGHG